MTYYRGMTRERRAAMIKLVQAELAKPVNAGNKNMLQYLQTLQRGVRRGYTVGRMRSHAEWKPSVAYYGELRLKKDWSRKHINAVKEFQCLLHNMKHTTPCQSMQILAKL